MTEPEHTTAFGLPIQALPPNWTPLEAFVVMKTLDDSGQVALISRATEGLNTWDAVGMLTAALDVQRAYLTDAFLEDEDEDDE